MDRMIYTASAGAARTLEAQAVMSNNLANVNTAGFREQLAANRAVPIVGEHMMDTRVSTVASTPGSHMRQGIMEETGHALDVAIRGPGWFAVQTEQGEAYTRAGEFSVNAQNQLVMSHNGLPVLSADGAPIDVPERGAITITSDGTVSALGAGENPRDVQMVGQLKLVNPPATDLARGDDGFFRLTQGGVAPADPAVTVVSGFVEKSNVSAAQAMVGMIANARHFEMQMKVIRDAATNEERANAILSFNA